MTVPVALNSCIVSTPAFQYILPKGTLADSGSLRLPFYVFIPCIGTFNSNFEIDDIDLKQIQFGNVVIFDLSKDDTKLIADIVSIQNHILGDMQLTKKEKSDLVLSAANDLASILYKKLPWYPCVFYSQRTQSDSAKASLRNPAPPSESRVPPVSLTEIPRIGYKRYSQPQLPSMIAGSNLPSTSSSAPKIPERKNSLLKFFSISDGSSLPNGSSETSKISDKKNLQSKVSSISRTSGLSNRVLDVHKPSESTNAESKPFLNSNNLAGLNSVSKISLISEKRISLTKLPSPSPLPDSPGRPAEALHLNETKVSRKNSTIFESSKVKSSPINIVPEGPSRVHSSACSSSPLSSSPLSTSPQSTSPPCFSSPSRSSLLASFSSTSSLSSSSSEGSLPPLSSSSTPSLSSSASVIIPSSPSDTPHWIFYAKSTAVDSSGQPSSLPEASNALQRKSSQKKLSSKSSRDYLLFE